MEEKIIGKVRAKIWEARVSERLCTWIWKSLHFIEEPVFKRLTVIQELASSLIISLSLFKVTISHILFPFTFNAVSPFQLSTDGLFLISLRK